MYVLFDVRQPRTIFCSVQQNMSGVWFSVSFLHRVSIPVIFLFLSLPVVPTCFITLPSSLSSLFLTTLLRQPAGVGYVCSVRCEKARGRCSVLCSRTEVKQEVVWEAAESPAPVFSPPAAVDYM